MDTNRDGIIDDPLATKKIGRRSLGLTEDEWKFRKNEQRKQRETDRATTERYQRLVGLACDIIQVYEDAKQKYKVEHPGEEEGCIDYAHECLQIFCEFTAKDENFYVKPLPKFRS